MNSNTSLIKRIFSLIEHQNTLLAFELSKKIEDINIFDKEGNSLLTNFIINLDENVESILMIKYLIFRGTDVNAKKKNGLSPLLAAGLYNRLAFSKILLEAGANPNVKHKDFSSTQIISDVLDLCYTRYLEASIKVLENRKNKYNWIRIRNINYELIKLLGANGAKLYNWDIKPELS
jgi:ankyrin repeat protein